MKYLYIDENTKRVLAFNDTPNKFCNIEVPEFDVEDFTDYYYLDGKVTINTAPRLARENKEKLQSELRTIKNWFLKTDYIPNKVITGEWQPTDQRWVNYLTERQLKRNRQDELNQLLKKLELTGETHES